MPGDNGVLILITRGTTDKVFSYTPTTGELVLNLDTNQLYAGDGSTLGGKLVTSRAVKTISSTYTALNGDFILADTSTNSFTITLPANPNPGDTVGIYDISKTFASKSVSPFGNFSTPSNSQILKVIRFARSSSFGISGIYFFNHL